MGMKFRLFTLFTLMYALGLSAQIDSENKSIAIPAEAVEDPKEDNEIIPKEVKRSDAKPEKTAKEKVTLSRAEQIRIKKRKEFSMVHDDKLRSPAELFQKQLKNALQLKEKEERRHNGSEVTQFLGQYSTRTKRVNVIYRDHQAPDGDLIRVYVNKDVMQSRVLLETHNKGFFLTLTPGDNVIDFEALNQGTSGPNTAEFKVIDGKGNIIADNQWNLATGVKATITVVLEKGEE